jgi:hypothetical protein
MQNETGYVYLINAKKTNRYKIGLTKNIKRRINGLQTSCPYKVQLVHAVFVGEAIRVEKALHDYFCNNRVFLEWFEFTPLEVKDVIKLMNFEHDIELYHLSVSIGMDENSEDFIDDEELVPEEEEEESEIENIWEKITPSEMIDLLQRIDSGQSQNQIIEEFFQVKKGGSIRYCNAKKIYDEVKKTPELPKLNNWTEITPIQKAELLNRISSGQSQNQIMEEFFKVRKGGSIRYKNAKKIYDEVKESDIIKTEK